MKTGDRVKIIRGPYQGQTGEIKTIVANGAFVRMDGDVAVFRPVKFENMELIEIQNQI